MKSNLRVRRPNADIAFTGDQDLCIALMVIRPKDWGRQVGTHNIKRSTLRIHSKTRAFYGQALPVCCNRFYFSPFVEHFHKVARVYVRKIAVSARENTAIVFGAATSAELARHLLEPPA